MELNDDLIESRHDSEFIMTYLKYHILSDEDFLPYHYKISSRWPIISKLKFGFLRL